MDDISLGSIVIVAVVLLLSAILFGLATLSLGRKKGYKGCFSKGFLYGVFGLIYTAGLPLAKELRQKDYRSLENDMKDILEFINTQTKKTRQS